MAESEWGENIRNYETNNRATKERGATTRSSREEVKSVCIAFSL